MITRLACQGRIDFDGYLDQYLRRDDAVRRLPTDDELRDLAVKGIVKAHVTLADVAAGEPARLGDTATLACESDLPRFDRQVTVSLGRGLYDRDLERAVAGHVVGDELDVTARGAAVRVRVVGLRRKQVPEPTDEMVAELGVKDDQGNPVTTVAGYEGYIRREKLLVDLSNVNYRTMEAMLADYPVDRYDEGDVSALGRLERDFFDRLFMEQEGIDLETQTPEQMQERWHVNSMDEFVALRHDWYQTKIHQCLIYLNVLGLPCEGATDPLDHYEVLSELQERAFEMIRDKYAERGLS